MPPISRCAAALLALTVCAGSGFAAEAWDGTDGPDVREGAEVSQDAWGGDDEITAVWSDQPSGAGAGRLFLDEGSDRAVVRTPPRQPPWGDNGVFEAHGGPGDDVITESGAGSTLITGGPGADVLTGGTGQNRVDGGPGDDTLDGGPGHDLVVGGPGRDRMSGGPGSDVLQTLMARGGRWVDDGEPDLVSCGAGYDLVVLGRGDTADRSCEVRYSPATHRVTGPRIIRAPAKMCGDYVIGPAVPHTIVMGSNRPGCEPSVASPRSVASFVIYGTGRGRRTPLRGLDIECRTNFVARVTFVLGLPLRLSTQGMGCAEVGLW